MGKSCSKEQAGRPKRPSNQLRERNSSGSSRAAGPVGLASDDLAATAAAAAAALPPSADKTSAAGGAVAAGTAAEEVASKAAASAVAAPDKEGGAGEGQALRIATAAADGGGETSEAAAAAVGSRRGDTFEEGTERGTENAAAGAVPTGTKRETDGEAAPHGTAPQQQEQQEAREKREDVPEEEEEEEQQEKRERPVEGVVDSSVVVVGGKKPEGREAAGEALLQPPPHFLAMDGVEVSETFTFYVEIFGLKCRNLHLPAFLSAASAEQLFDSTFLNGPASAAAASPAAAAGAGFSQGSAAGAAAPAGGGQAAKKSGAAATAGGGVEDEEKKRRKESKEEDEEQKQQQQRSSVTQWLLLPFFAGASKEQQQSLRAAAALQAAAAAAAERSAAGAAAGTFDPSIHPYIFCAVDWVDCTLYVETEGVPVTAAPAWPSSKCQFSWCCSLLRQLQQRRVIISIYCCIPEQLDSLSSSVLLPPLLPSPSSPPRPASPSSASLQRVSGGAAAASAASAAASASPAAAASSSSPAGEDDAAGAAFCRRRRGGGGGEVVLSDEDAAAGEGRQQQEGAAATAEAQALPQREEGAKAGAAVSGKKESRSRTSSDRKEGGGEKEMAGGAGGGGKTSRQRKGIVTLLGRASVDLLTVATGPVHHDLLLQRPKLAAEKQQRPRRQGKTPPQQQQQQPVGSEGGKKRKTEEEEDGKAQQQTEDEEELTECGRVVVDIKMAQICRLIINPIEILVRLQQEQHAAAASASSKAGTARRLAAASLRAATRRSKRAAAAALAAAQQGEQKFEDETEFFAAARDVPAAPSGGQRAAARDAEEETAAAAAEGKRHADARRTGRLGEGAGEAEAGKGRERGTGATEAATGKKLQATGSGRVGEVKAKCPEVVSSSVVGDAAALSLHAEKASAAAAQQQQRREQWRREQRAGAYEGRERWSAAGAAATAAAAAAAAAAEEQQLEATDAGRGGGGAGAEAEEAFFEGETHTAVCGPTRKSSEQGRGDEEDATTTAASENPLVPPEEEPGPLLAHWQLSFRVTGVVNAAAFYSTWTEKTDQPYWNTVDHSLLQLTGRPGCVRNTSADTPQQQSKRRGREGAAAAPEEEATAAAGSLDAQRDKAQTSADQGSKEAASPQAERKGESGWRSLLSAFGLSSWASSTSFSSSTASSSSAEIDAAGDSVAASSCSSTSPEVAPGSQTFSSSSASSSTSSAAATACGVEQQQEREVILDRDSTYRRLGALARRGRLVKDVLYDDFPTMQLVTTVDALRQNYLQISLFSRCFAADVPVFQGECWLPFMKLYEADVADEVEKHFYESSFCERLWVDGRCVGEIEGILVFQNNPIVRQMHAGVHTEHGCVRALPPIVQLQQQLEQGEGSDADAEGQGEEEDEEEEAEEEEEGEEEEDEEPQQEPTEEEEPQEQQEGSVTKAEEDGRGKGGGGEDREEAKRNGRRERRGKAGRKRRRRRDSWTTGRSSNLSGTSERAREKRLLRLLPPPIQRVAALHRMLLELLFSKAQHRAGEILLEHVTHTAAGAGGAAGKVEGRAAAAAAGGKRTPGMGGDPLATAAAKEAAAAGKGDDEEDGLFTAAGKSWLLPHGVPFFPPAQGKLLPRAEDMDQAQTNAAGTEFQRVCEELLQVLSEGEGEMRRCFLYATEEALLTAQQVLLNLATHTLEYVDYVHWHHRLFYSSILHLILRRGELDIGTLVPSRVAVKKYCVPRFVRHMRAMLLQEENRSKQQEEEEPQRRSKRQPVADTHKERDGQQRDVGGEGREEGEKGGRGRGEEERRRKKRTRKKKRKTVVLELQHGDSEAADKEDEEEEEEEGDEEEQEAGDTEEEEVRQRRQQELQDIERELSSSSENEEDEEDEEKGFEKEEAEKQRQQQQRLSLNLAKVHLLYSFVKRLSRLASRSSFSATRQQQGSKATAAGRPQAAAGAPSHPSPAPSPPPPPSRGAAAAEAAPQPPAGKGGEAAAAAATAGEEAAAAASEAGEGGTGGRGRGEGSTEEAAARVKQQPFNQDGIPAKVDDSGKTSAAGTAARDVEPAAGSPAPAAPASTASASASSTAAPPAASLPMRPPSSSAATADEREKSRPTKKKTLSLLRDLVKRKGTDSATASAEKKTSQQQQQGAILQQLQQPQASDTLAEEEGAGVSPLMCTTATHAAATAAADDSCVGEQRKRSPPQRRADDAAGAAAARGNTASAAGAAPFSATREKDIETMGKSREGAARETSGGRNRDAGDLVASVSGTEESCGLLLREGSTFSYTSGKSFTSSHPSFISALTRGSSQPKHAALPGGSASMWVPAQYEACASAAVSEKWGKADTSAAAAGAAASWAYSEAAGDPRLQLPRQRSSTSGIDAVVVAALARVAQELPEAGRQALTAYHKRMKIARQYYILLHRMLLHAVAQLKPGSARGVVFEAQRRYVAVFLAIAYFRLPAFKDELLACVLSPAEREEAMPEWRGTEYSLDARSLQRMQQWDKYSELRVSLDWRAFHSTLKGYFGATALRQAVACMQEECGEFVCPPAATDLLPPGGAVSVTNPAATTASASSAPGSTNAAASEGGCLSVFPAELSSSWQWHFSPANRGSLFFAFLEQWCRYVFQSVPSLWSAFTPATGAAAQGAGDAQVSLMTEKGTSGWRSDRSAGGRGTAMTQRKSTAVPLIGAAAVFQKKTAAAFAAALTGTRGKPAVPRPVAGGTLGAGARSPRVPAAAPAAPRPTDFVPYSRERSCIEAGGTPAMLLLLPWQEIPGYAVLLKALLLEMKKRPVTKYPDSLLNSSGAMLANVKLLSVFSKVLFLKTSVYNSPAVFAALNYLDYWMQVVRMRGQQLPPGFDFNFLRRGLQIVVSSDLCVNVAKGIWFIYKNLPVLLLLRQPSLQHGEPVYAGDSTGSRQGISSGGKGRGSCVSAGAIESNAGANILFLLVHEQFPRLFLSWSWLVRKAYMWFLLYRVCETARRVVTRANPLLAAAQATATEAAGGTAAASSSPIPASSSASAGAEASGNNEPAATRATSTGKSNTGTTGTAAASPGSVAAAGAELDRVSKDATGGTTQQGSSTPAPGAAGEQPESVSTAETDKTDAMLRNLLLQLQLTEEEMILFQAYMVLAGFLKRLEAPLVLPYKTTSVVSLALQRQQSLERECAAAAGAQPLSRGGRFRYMVTARSNLESVDDETEEAAAAARSNETPGKNGVTSLNAGAAAAASSSATGDSQNGAQASYDTFGAPGGSRLTQTEATHGAAAPLDSEDAAGATSAGLPCATVSAALGTPRDATGTTQAPSGEVPSTAALQQVKEQVPGMQREVRLNTNERQFFAAPGGEVTEVKAHPPASVDAEKAAVAGGAAVEGDEPESEQLRQWLNGEAANLPPQRAVYAAIAQREWVEEVAVYRDWVMAGASPLPSMHIPSAPLDANTDVPLDS